MRGGMADVNVRLSLNERLAAVYTQPPFLSQKDYRSVTHTHSGAPRTSPRDIISEGDRETLIALWVRIVQLAGLDPAWEDHRTT